MKIVRDVNNLDLHTAHTYKSRREEASEQHRKIKGFM